MAAYRSGMKTVVIPAENESDLQDIEPIVRENVEFVMAETMKTVLDTALCQSVSSATGITLPNNTSAFSFSNGKIPQETTMKQ